MLPRILRHSGATSGQPLLIITCHRARNGRQTKHGGLKEFIDHVARTFGRSQLKPTTECLRGVATYPSGDQRQERYNMTLTDLMNNHYTRGVREAMMELILGRSENVVKVGDVVEMLLSISFAVKDAMLEWEWLGIDPKEWPPQRLDWEMYRIEHLSFVSNMEAQFAARTALAYSLFSAKVHGLSELATPTSVPNLPQYSPQQRWHT